MRRAITEEGYENCRREILEIIILCNISKMPEKIVIDKSSSITAALDDLNAEISEDYSSSNKISK